MADVLMPRLSEGMEEGTVLTWMKAVGDEVAVGDELVEIETDKANMVYEAEAAGTLTEIVADEGDTLPVGSVIARLGGGGGADAEPASKNASAEAPAAPPEAPAAPPAPEPAVASAAQPAHGVRVKVSPVARRLARAHGIDLTAIQGIARDGRIRKADVQTAIARWTAGAAAPPPTAAAPGRADPAVARDRGAVEAVRLSRLQETVARRMAESATTAPHFYLEAEIDMTRCVAARARLKATAAEGEVVPSFNDMVVKACALALRALPKANGAYANGELHLFERINVGIAVAGDDALVVPTIFDADRKGLAEIATESRELAGRVRAGTIAPAELSGGTFTVSNLGMHGVSRMYPVVNPPQAGILGVGKIDERPIGRAGELVLAPMLSVVLASDHRIVYGADGARLLGSIKAALEEPLRLAL